MTGRGEERYGWAAAAAFLSGATVILLYLALARQHDVWFGCSPVTAGTGIFFFALWTLAGIGAARLLRIGSRGLAAVCLAAAAAALAPLLFPGLLVRSWEALLLAPAGVARGTALTALGWRVALRLALPGLAAGCLAAGCAHETGRVPWRRAVFFLAGAAAAAPLFRAGIAALGFERLLAAVVCLAAAAAMLHLVAAAARGAGAAAGVAAAAAADVADRGDHDDNPS